MLFTTKSCRTLLIASLFVLSEALPNKLSHGDQQNEVTATDATELDRRELSTEFIASRDTNLDTDKILSGSNVLARGLHAKPAPKPATKAAPKAGKARACASRRNRGAAAGKSKTKSHKRNNNKKYINDLLLAPTTHLVEMSDVDFLPTGKVIGSDGFCGCTAVVVAGHGGALVAHFDEIPDDAQFKAQSAPKLKAKLTEKQTETALQGGKAYIVYPLNSRNAPIYPHQLKELETELSHFHPKAIGYKPMDFEDPDFGKDPTGSVIVDYANHHQTVYIEGVAQ